MESRVLCSMSLMASGQFRLGHYYTAQPCSTQLTVTWDTFPACSRSPVISWACTVSSAHTKTKKTKSVNLCSAQLISAQGCSRAENKQKKRALESARRRGSGVVSETWPGRGMMDIPNPEVCCWLDLSWTFVCVCTVIIRIHWMLLHIGDYTCTWMLLYWLNKCNYARVFYLI